MSPETTEIIQAIKSMHTPKSEASKVFDYLFKGASTLSIAGVMWIVGNLSQVKQDISNIKIENQYSQKTFEKMNDFIEKPRFTADDYDAKIQPIIKQLNENTVELNTRSLFIEATQEKLIRLDIRIEQLEK